VVGYTNFDAEVSDGLEKQLLELRCNPLLNGRIGGIMIGECFVEIVYLGHRAI